MPDAVATMIRAFGLTPMDCYLMLVIPRFRVTVAGGATTWRRAEVEADLRAALLEDDSDKVATETLIGKLPLLNLTHCGWFTLGARAARPDGELFVRPD
jgi:hypothetical protein